MDWIAFSRVSYVSTPGEVSFAPFSMMNYGYTTACIAPLKGCLTNMEMGCWWFGCGDEPQIFSNSSVVCWFLTLKFTFFRSVAKGCPLYVIGATLLQMCQRLLATLWQICLQGSEGMGNPLKNAQRVFGTFVNSTHLPEGCQYPLVLCQRVLMNVKSSLQRVLDKL